jgi:hypothetical protein
VNWATTGRRAVRSMALGYLAIAGAVALGGCDRFALDPDPTIQAATDIVLRPASGDLGCDTVQVPYRSVTFSIDPAAEDDVTATTDLGAGLMTYWSLGFRGGTAADPVVYGPNDEVVVSDGDVLTIPVGEWPSLSGYFVCPSPNALYIFSTGP